MKTYVYTKSCRQILETLFVIAKNWKKSKFPSVSESLNNLSYNPIMRHYSEIRTIHTSNNLVGSKEKYAEWKKESQKGTIPFQVYDSIHKPFLKWWNCKGDHIIDDQRLGWEHRRDVAGTMKGQQILVSELFCIFTVVVVIQIPMCEHYIELSIHIHVCM